MEDGENEYGNKEINPQFVSYHVDTFFNDIHKILKRILLWQTHHLTFSNWGADKLKDDVRWKYGILRLGNANYVWIQYMIHHVAPNGKKFNIC